LFQKLSRNKRNAIAVSVVALVLFVLYIVIRVALMVNSLQSTISQVDSLQSAVAKKDLAAISIELGKASDSLSIADSSAKDPLVQLVTYLPIIGNDIKAASIISSDGHLVLQSAQDVSNTANQLLKAGIGKKALTDSTLISTFRLGMGAMNDAVQKLNVDLQGIDSGSLHFGLDKKVASAKSTVSVLASTAAKITPLIDVASVVLEQPEKKRWFVAIQNLSEARATGGITGAYAILVAENGKVKLQEYGSDKTLLKLGKIDYSSYPEDLRNLWGVDLTDWRDINASAHVPYAAQLLADGWKQHRGETVDGVLFIGQGAVGELSGAVGPITIRGVTVDPDNVVDFLTKDIYAKFTDVRTKDAVVGELANEMFTRLIAGKLNIGGFFKAAANDKTGDRIMAWAQDSAIQHEFIVSKSSGEVSEQFGPNVLVTVNNAGGNKLDAYAQLKIDYRTAQCNVDTFTGYQGRKSSVAIEISNNAPKSGLPAYVVTRLDRNFGESRPKGSNRELVTVYGPVGSEAESVTVNGKADFVSTGFDRNRPVWIFDISLLPGETKKLVVNLVEPISDDNQEKVIGSPSVIAPVMLNAPVISTSTIGECSLK
jgi:hypothetical protein